MGKLGRATEAAMGRIEACAQAVEKRAHHLGGKRRVLARRAWVGARERLNELGVLRIDLGAPFAPDRRDTLTERGKGGHAVARALREVGSAEERRPVRREKQGERPAAGALREHLVGRLVDVIEVRPLLAVDLHVDEKPVHHRRDFRVLEALARHDVAPMARGVADREQDRLVLGAGARERFLAPRIPVHRVGGVLLQVRRSFADEAVRHRRKRNPRASGGFLLDGCQLTEPSG